MGQGEVEGQGEELAGGQGKGQGEEGQKGRGKGGREEWSRGRGTKGETYGGNKNKRKCRSSTINWRKAQQEGRAEVGPKNWTTEEK